MNLLNLFKQRNKEEGEIKNIQLYCQNPQCKHPLITEGVAEVNGALVHPSEECIEMYGAHKALNSGNTFICSIINYMPHNAAELLARKGKVKFSSLENKTGEEQ